MTTKQIKPRYITIIVVALFALGSTIFLIGVKTHPMYHEVDASGYKFVGDLLELSCPSETSKTKLKELIGDDNILSRFEMDEFHTFCDAERLDAKKKELMQNL